jgi:hypothetical protein
MRPLPEPSVTHLTHVKVCHISLQVIAFLRLPGLTRAVEYHRSRTSPWSAGEGTTQPAAPTRPTAVASFPWWW